MADDALTESGPARSAGEVYATRTVTAFLRENPDTPLNEVFSHFFPPTTHPFTREELRRAIIEGLYYGRLTWDSERRLNVALPAQDCGPGMLGES
jgi:hypothetical protein